MEYCNNAILYCEMVVQLCLMWQSAVLQFWGLIPTRIKPGIPNIEDHLLFKELNVKTVREQKIPLWLQEKNAKTSVCHVLHASKNFIFLFFSVKPIWLTFLKTTKYTYQFVNAMISKIVAIPMTSLVMYCVRASTYCYILNTHPFVDMYIHKKQIEQNIE